MKCSQGTETVTKGTAEGAGGSPEMDLGSAALPVVLSLGDICSHNKVDSLHIMKFNKLYPWIFHLYKLFNFIV